MIDHALAGTKAALTRQGMFFSRADVKLLLLKE